MPIRFHHRDYHYFYQHPPSSPYEYSRAPSYPPLAPADTYPRRGPRITLTLPVPTPAFVPPTMSPHLSAAAQARKDSLASLASHLESTRIEGEQRLIVVSNRLPVTIAKDAKGEYTYKMSSGGLVSALSGCKKTMNFTWIGWPGKEVRVAARQAG